MKKLMLLMVLCASTTLFAQRTNFSGNWMINKSKIDFGNAPEFILSKSIKVDQQSDKITISSINVDQELNEQPAVVNMLSFDGKPFQRTAASGTVITSVLKWLDDYSFELHIQSKSDVVETWTLEDGGKTLIINRNVDQGNLKYTIKAIYDKQ